MKGPVKTFEEFIKENLTTDSEDSEVNDPETQAFLNKYMEAMYKLDSRDII
jgi:hypothetical protein